MQKSASIEPMRSRSKLEVIQLIYSFAPSAAAARCSCSGVFIDILMRYLRVLLCRPEFAAISVEYYLPPICAWMLMRSTKSTLANSKQTVIRESSSSSSIICVIQTSRGPRVRECTKADSLEHNSSLAFLQFSRERSPQS